GVHLLTAPTGGTLTLNTNGTFTYVAGASTTSDSFSYCANGSVTAGVCSSGITANVNLGRQGDVGSVTCSALTFNANTATYLAIKTPGVLSGCKDTSGYPLTVVTSDATAPVPSAGLTLVADTNGGFTASVATAGTYTFSFNAKNSQGTTAGGTVTLNF